MRLVLAASLALIAAPAEADGIEEMCLDSSKNNQEICDCAKIAIIEAFPNENIQVYEAVARNFFEGATPDDPGGDWDAAVQAAADEMGMHVNEATVMSNEVTQAHRSAIKSCRGE